MSLEANIQALTAALGQYTAALQALAANAPVPLQQSATVPAAPAAPAMAPVYQQTPAGPVDTGTFAPAPVTAPPAAPAMPAPPAFAAPAAPVAPAAPAGGAPFNDVAGLAKYTMEMYQALGPERGGKIQELIVAAGVQQLSDIPATHYAWFYQSVEALRG